MLGCCQMGKVGAGNADKHGYYNEFDNILQLNRSNFQLPGENCILLLEQNLLSYILVFGFICFLSATGFHRLRIFTLSDW